jgi:hypothetical protein
MSCVYNSMDEISPQNLCHMVLAFDLWVRQIAATIGTEPSSLS